MPCRGQRTPVGPGVLDMKSGIVLMLYAIPGFRAWMVDCRGRSPLLVR